MIYTYIIFSNEFFYLRYIIYYYTYLLYYDVSNISFYIITNNLIFYIIRNFHFLINIHHIKSVLRSINNNQLIFKYLPNLYARDYYFYLCIYYDVFQEL